MVYSSDLRHGENPVPRCTSTPDQPTLLLQFSIPSLYSRDLTCDAQSKKLSRAPLHAMCQVQRAMYDQADRIY